jgi:hypothetical protein
MIGMLRLVGFPAGFRHFLEIKSPKKKQSLNSMDWFVGENLQETIDFPIKYGAFL